ncbi:MAG TPA: hypothetical protein VGC39_11815 [Candidatus Methylacidiphilales bacterium]
MKDRQSNWGVIFARLLDLLLVLAILGGVGYLVYYHPEEIQSLKVMVGLAEPETPNPAAAASPQESLPVPPAPSPAPAMAPSTNNANNPPLVGQPRSALPAQDHWTWTTTDGKTYQEVKIEKIEDDYVTIIHADGGARLPISTLPDDVQKKVNDYLMHAP